jgi:hypothetical protein
MISDREEALLNSKFTFYPEDEQHFETDLEKMGYNKAD